MDGTPEQGFQSRLTPQEIYRIGIQEINAICRARYERPFDQLQPEKQDEMLKALEKGQVDLPSLSSKLFFDLLWRNTEEGFFADPLYGGNRGKVGWKLLGFPGMPSGVYKDHIDNPAPLHFEPVSMLDVQQGKAQLDGNGFAKHITIKPAGAK